VRLDGVDVSSWNRDELGPHLGYLPQQVNLLDGTLADNIGRFGPADPAKIMDAVNAAGLSAFVEGLPKGIDSELGVGGAWLSGGLRQRVGLARALYGQPALVVLDEPNASLDEAGDAALALALDALRARACTVVVMSHRKSVISQADHLLVLRDGQQVGFGPRDDVLDALRKAGAFPAEEAQPAAQLPRTPVAPGLA
jgi:ATP-binding cassette subfamily C exporter for protease/lipase